MPTVQHNKGGALGPGQRVPGKGIVKWRRLQPLLKEISAKCGMKLSFDGMDAQEIAGGVHLKATPGVGAEDYPFKTEVLNDGGDLFARIAPGSVSGIVPLIGGVPLDALEYPLLAIASTGVQRIYLETTASLFATDEGYVVSWTVTGATMQVTSGAVPADDTSGVYRRHVATVEDGFLTAQVVCNSLEILLRDLGAGLGTALAVYNLAG
jgi:hypothetical protein